MNHWGRILAIFIFASSIWSCSTEQKTRNQNIDKLGISWKLIENRINETCIAEFKFINNSKDSIKYGNWALYFNQNTLRTAEMQDSLKGIVEHVNGDLYRFLPKTQFLIKPMDSITVRYTYNGFLIKDGDTPVGAYFVDNHLTNKEKVVMPYSFTKESIQSSPSTFPIPDAFATLPTAAFQYNNNLNISELETSKIGKIIPSPLQMKNLEGKMIINQSTAIVYKKGLENEANFLVASLKKLFDLNLKATEGSPKNTNTIELNLGSVSVPSNMEEAYEINVRPNTSLQINGNKSVGVFYGIQSLLSLMWADKEDASLYIKNVEIKDAPRFPYRGFLLDFARNFTEKKDVLRLIELLASYKINKLNIRITEDEGWRIEIKNLPELTEVGSKRGHTQNSKNWLTPSFGSGPNPDSENNYGKGYYTREDFNKEILKHAQKHYVEVIPEVCFPSHARAAIKSMEARYDKYMAKKDIAKANEFRLIDPNDQSTYISAQMYKDNIANVAMPSVYHFYETVVKDFVDMYQEAGLKLNLFNTGGDEVPNGAWAKSPLCIELMKSLPDIKEPRHLQGYFLEKAMNIFNKYNLEISGWEEIVLNKDSNNKVTVNPKFVGKKVLPLVWDNTGDNVDLGYRIANAGYPVVLCNVTNLYFDLAYSIDPKETGLYWGGFQDAIDPYLMAPYDVYKTTNFDRFGRLTNVEEKYPGKQRLQATNQNKIVGLQAQLWSETIKGHKMLEYYLVPKIFAFAEKAWSQPPTWEKDPNINSRNASILSVWNILSNQIGKYELPKIDKAYSIYNYRIAPPGGIIENGMLKVNTSFPGLSIRYTSDGKDPSVNSPLYKAPVAVTGKVKIRAFNEQGRASRVIEVN